MRRATADGVRRRSASPARIAQVGFAFWQSKALLSAAELGVFTELGAGPMTAGELAARLGLRSRATRDFPDALAALSFLMRDGDGCDAVYRNTETSGIFLDRAGPRYVGAALELANSRLYPSRGGLNDALRTGDSQVDANQSSHTRATHQGSTFTDLYADPARAEGFLRAMAALSAENFSALADVFDFSRYSTLCDVGGATGQLSIILATRYRLLRCTVLDLPAVEPIARRTVADSGIGDRIAVVSGGFLTDPLPRADVITMGACTTGTWTGSCG